LSSVRTSVGFYTLSFTTTPLSTAPSTVLLQIRLGNGFIQYSGLGASGMTVRTYSVNGTTLTDYSFSVVAYL